MKENCFTYSFHAWPFPTQGLQLPSFAEENKSKLFLSFWKLHSWLEIPQYQPCAPLATGSFHSPWIRVSGKTQERLLERSFLTVDETKASSKSMDPFLWAVPSHIPPPTPLSCSKTQPCGSCCCTAGIPQTQLSVEHPTVPHACLQHPPD